MGKELDFSFFWIARKRIRRLQIHVVEQLSNEKPKRG